MDVGMLHNIIGECWKPIKGFPAYLISNRGRVWSLTRQDSCKTFERVRQGRFLRPRIGKNGYMYVILTRNGKEFTKTVHRLVAENFIPNTQNCLIVNHKDECKTNNDVNNLEWCTKTYNYLYGKCRENRLRTLRQNGVIRRVQQLTLDGVVVGVYNSIKEAERRFSENGSNICNCCRSRIKSAYGYKWRYVLC